MINDNLLDQIDWARTLMKWLKPLNWQQLEAIGFLGIEFLHIYIKVNWNKKNIEEVKSKMEM